MVRAGGRAASYALLVLIGIGAIGPFVLLALLSTKKRIDIVGEVPPSLHVDWATAKDNYRTAIEDDAFGTFIRNSVVVTGAATLIGLVLGVPAAYGFSRLRFRGRDHWAATILSFRFMPPVAVAIPIALMMRDIGQDDSLVGLVLPYVAFSLPLIVWIMIGFFDEVPRELDDAAMVDGCTRVGALVRVILPLARPGIAVAAIFTVIFMWNEFLVGLFVVSSPDRQTVPIAASTLLTVQSPLDFNTAAAFGVLTLVPILVFALYAQRYIVRGITAGAIK